MKLNELRDNPGATKDRIRVGRGIGSGKGKTAGRGVKGQKARSGVAIKGFEGGQMPIHMRLPKRGFNNPLRLNFVHINLDRVQEAIDAGKLDAKSVIDVEGADCIRRASPRAGRGAASRPRSGEGETQFQGGQGFCSSGQGGRGRGRLC